MPGIRPTMRGVLVSSRRRGVGALLGAAAAAIFVTTTYGQSILGPPSEANHFIETPKGWVHPKTPWGEPDIQAMLNMMQAAGVPLERCANSYRFGGPPCDMNKQWWTEEEYKRAPRGGARRGDLGRELIAKGEFGRALLSGVTDPSTPQRQTNLIVDPPNGLLPDLTPEAKRRALQMGSSWSLPGEDPVYEDPLDFDFWDNCRSRGMPSSMMPYRYNGGFQHPAGARRRRVRPRDDPRRAHHLHRWPAAAVVGAQAVHGRIARPLGGQHARHRDDQLQGRPADDQPRRRRIASREPLPGQRPNEDDGADHAPERRHVALRDQDGGPGHPHASVHGALPDAQRPDLRVVGVRVPRRATRSFRTTARPTATSARIRRPEPPAKTAQVSADVANALAGRWTGRPRSSTVDYDIFLEFTQKRGRHGARKTDRHRSEDLPRQGERRPSTSRCGTSR